MLDINSSLFIQVINFLILLFLLNILLYRPIRSILSRRNEEMNSLRDRVDGFREKSAEQQQKIEQGMVLARKEGFQEKENFKGQGVEEEKSILKEASSSAEQKMGKAKAELEKKMAEVRKTLEEHVAVFSKELAEKILGRSTQ